MRLRPTHLFTLILGVYLQLGTLFAAATPDWQTPDEPAHYNYVGQLAAGSLPVIESGDYDQTYLEELKGAGFPEDRPIDQIQYEDHQPPLYYALAMPIYWLFDGALLPLRLFSVLLGAGVICLAFKICLTVLPGRPLVVLSAVSLVAFIPQHIAMLAGVNNDSLAELLLAAALLGAIYLIQADEPQRPWLLGLLLGAIFWTKAQAYIAAPVLGLAIILRWQRDGRDKRWLLRWLGGVLGLGLLIGAIWWGRNLAVYGGMDWMGLNTHDSVVVGQPTTAAWIEQEGLPATLLRLVQFTFQSFWGMFGWMGVPMDVRVYQGLVVLTAVTVVGLGFWLCTCPLTTRAWGRHSGTERLQKYKLVFGQVRWEHKLKGELNDRIVGWLLALSAALTMAGYLWYNLKFVQHQGRYLFPALAPLALAFGLAWEQLTQERPARITARLLAVATVLLGSWGFARGDLPVWLMIYCAGAAGLLWGNSCLPAERHWPLPAAVSLGLAVLSFASVFLFIVPGLK